jgi:hypothetical protein
MTSRTRLAALADRARRVAARLIAARIELDLVARQGRSAVGPRRTEAQLAGALARRLRAIVRARACTLGDVAIKLRLVEDMSAGPDRLTEPDALVRSAIRDLEEIGRPAP